ncbi:response regulator transcription factor [Maribellus sp. CM-23]|uniref:response regulator transcription factor n=1 Tax=Maribellus sp. CM-23 TaxID=2781026 RepID=UPI001F25B287|nr:response regulator transcription factor [Maribellus sp. CM-23]MCE4565487.1 response regulator transcription factor [Maribellus sp. CM-23]
MNTTGLKIVVTDDHKLFRKGMAALLSDFEEVGEISEAGNGLELLDLISTMPVEPDVVLLDVNMPEMDGVETTRRLKLEYPSVRIIILSMEDDVQLVSHLVSEGVNGYLLKNADPDELELALKKVMKNDFYFSASLTSAVLKSSTTVVKQASYTSEIDLSERENQVLQLICEELTAAEIADRLSLSARTVEGYKRNLLEKTGTRNMAGLVICAMKNNLIQV